MGFNPGKRWEKESESLYIHESGARISKSAYRGQDGWWVFPVDLDAPPLQFPATEAGRDEAFATFEKGLPKPPPKPKPKKKPVPPPEDDEPVAKGGGDDDEADADDDADEKEEKDDED